MRNAQQSAVALDIIALMDALKIQKAIVAGFDWGARTADVMAVLWPERCKAIVSVSGYLISSPAGNQMPLPPEPAFLFWYQYYFATRGRQSRLCEVPSTSSISSSGTRLHQSGISTMPHTTAQQHPSTTRTMWTS